jgi:hypothetical protein
VPGIWASRASGGSGIAGVVEAGLSRAAAVIWSARCCLARNAVAAVPGLDFEKMAFITGI